MTTPANSEFAMLGFGKESCSEMVETTSTGSQMDQVYKFAYTAYILGFFSERNFRIYFLSISFINFSFPIDYFS